MKKRLVLILTIVFLVSLVLVACAPKAEPQTAPQEPKTETQTPQPESQEPSAEPKEEAKKIVVGYCQGESNSAWKVAENDSIKKAVEAQGWEFKFADANGSTPKQVSDVEDMVVQGVDYILVSPREIDGLQPALDAAKAKNIPVILIDREINAKFGEDYLTFVGGDFYKEGVTAGEYVVKNWPDAKVVEIYGSPASSVAVDRTNGFAEAIKDTGVSIISAQNGDWARATAEKVMANVAQAQKGNIDVIYSHSDEMTFGILVALKNAGLTPGVDVQVVSIDGQKLAIQKIIDGEMAAIVECTPLLGPPAVQVILDYMEGKEIQEKYIQTGLVFDKTNAVELLDRGV